MTCSRKTGRGFISETSTRPDSTESDYGAAAHLMQHIQTPLGFWESSRCVYEVRTLGGLKESRLTLTSWDTATTSNVFWGRRVQEERFEIRKLCWSTWDMFVSPNASWPTASTLLNTCMSLFPSDCVRFQFVQKNWPGNRKLRQKNAKFARFAEMEKL